jgi:hypothetical protein
LEAIEGRGAPQQEAGPSATLRMTNFMGINSKTETHAAVSVLLNFLLPTLTHYSFVSYQTRQLSFGTMGEPTLQPKAAANPG